MFISFQAVNYNHTNQPNELTEEHHSVSEMVDFVAGISKIINGCSYYHLRQF